MSDVLRVLTEARELISDEGRWTTGQFAKTSQGQMIDPKCESAACWCVAGAIRKFDPNDEVVGPAHLALSRQCMKMFDRKSYIEVNDGLGHPAIMSALDAAIASEQAKSQSAAS